MPETHKEDCAAYAHKAFLPELCDCGLLPKKKKEPLKWMAQAGFISMIQSGDLKLALTVNQAGGAWNAIAVETIGTDVSSVFASHGHHVIGEFPSVTEALTACENYVATWRTGKRLEECDCEEI
jgi:hypothetical protein